MISSRSLLLSLAVGFSTIITLPNVYASELGQVFQETMNSDYSYEAAVSATLDGNIMGEEIPFDLFVDINSQGTKDGFDFSNTTALQAKLSNFSSEISDEVGGLSMISVWGTLENWFFEKGQTSYSKLNGFNLRSDNDKVNKIVKMVQETVKAVTGRTYRISLDELVESVLEIVPENQQSSEIENLMSIFNGNLSIQKQIEVSVKLYDQLIDAGLLKVEMGRSGSSSALFINGPTTSYKLSLASQLTEEQVVMVKNVLADFYNGMVPGLGDQIVQDMSTGSDATDTRLVNDFLRAAARTGATMELIVSQNRIVSVSADFDLNPAGIPLVASLQQTFSYGPQQKMVEPSEESTVNVNALIDGFLVIGSMTQAAFEDDFDYTEGEDFMIEEFNFDEDQYDQGFEQDFSEVAAPTRTGLSPRMIQMRKEAAVERIMNRIALSCEYKGCARAVASKMVRDWQNNYSQAELQEIHFEAFTRIDMRYRD